MITPTHVLANVWLASKHEGPADRRAMRWFVFGGLAPDIPLYLLSGGSLLWYGITAGMAPPEILDHAFNTMFFENPVWKAANSFFHAPLILLATWGAGRRLGGDRGRRVEVFAVGAGIHAVVDILVHHSDGPLLLFPLNWTYRFASPVSYYEPEHFGRPMSFLDMGLTLGLGVWAFRRWRRTGVVIGPAPASVGAPDVEPHASNEESRT